MRDLVETLQALYSREINVSISCFWDGGWEIKLGDEMNGFRAEVVLENGELGSAAEWLAVEAQRHWPLDPTGKCR
jgi:hypothetical protein